MRWRRAHACACVCVCVCICTLHSHMYISMPCYIYICIIIRFHSWILVGQQRLLSGELLGRLRRRVWAVRRARGRTGSRTVSVEARRRTARYWRAAGHLGAVHALSQRYVVVLHRHGTAALRLGNVLHRNRWYCPTQNMKCFQLNTVTN